MNLNELENKGLSNSEKKENKQANSIPENQPSLSNPLQQSHPLILTRSVTDWRLILKLSIILSVLVGILLGGVAGFFIGKSIYQNQTTSQQQQTNTDEEKDSIYSQYDYTKFVIDAENNVTIESFYNDDEERFFAMQLIGKKVPDLKYLDGEAEVSISSLGKDRYIIEFVEPDCAFCNKMITTVDAYRATEGALDVIGLSIKDGDLTNFNKEGKHTFQLINKDAETEDLVSLVVWVPTFIYVENGTIKLVTFGNMKDVEEFKSNIDLAFK